MGGWGRTALGAAVIAVASACGPAPTTVVDDSTTGAATSTTRAPRIVDDSGRPDITFDPCLDLPDEVMSAAGYNAAHKEFADMPMGSYTFLGCEYNKPDLVPGVRRGYGLNVLSGNVTLDEELKKNADVAIPTTVNGRPALREVGPSGNDECTYALQTSFGIVLFNRLYNKDHAGPVARDEWCAGMEEFMASVEPYIGDSP
ncbi:DUF3558 domain-containing protein [Rhodococcus sp. NPDC060090]|uniref:DUF3558 domain-containing protein n=1 Tax=Rhodococcus sp. NPDC060090 TaxID=3347056 RepID=UPI00365F2DFB